MRLALFFSLALSACLMPPQNNSGGNYAGSQPASEPAPAGEMATQPASSNPNAIAAAPQGPVSVTIRSACSKTVKVFYGDKPKFGSGTYSSIDSNSVQSHSFRAGAQLWIVDDSQNGLGSVSVAPGMHELEVSSSCTQISSR